MQSLLPSDEDVRAWALATQAQPPLPLPQTTSRRNQLCDRPPRACMLHDNDVECVAAHAGSAAARAPRVHISRRTRRRHLCARRTRRGNPPMGSDPRGAARDESGRSALAAGLFGGALDRAGPWGAGVSARRRAAAACVLCDLRAEYPHLSRLNACVVGRAPRGSFARRCRAGPLRGTGRQDGASRRDGWRHRHRADTQQPRPHRQPRSPEQQRPQQRRRRRRRRSQIVEIAPPRLVGETARRLGPNYAGHGRRYRREQAEGCA